MRAQRMSEEQRIRFAGVPTTQILSYIDDELKEMSACIRLPVVILLFVSFVCAVSFHERLDVVNGQRNAMIYDLQENAVFAFGENTPFENPRMGHKNLYDANTFADFWSWLNLGLVPLLWTDREWPLSESR